MILTIRTDKPEAEVGLYKGSQELAYKRWEAHRQLGTTIHASIKEILDLNDKSWSDIDKIIFYKGPGSFTGLRIGASVANALADSNNSTVSNQNGETWIEDGIKDLESSKNRVALPEYGSAPHITVQKK